MAASLTHHVWTTTELLSYPVPPHFLDALPDLERLYPPFEAPHHERTGTSPHLLSLPLFSKPPVIAAAAPLYNYSLGQCSPARPVCCAHLNPRAHTPQLGMRMGGPCRHN